jgi:GDSL-like Lipase/Acylhydrolase family
MAKIIEFHGDSTQAGAALTTGNQYITTVVPPALQVGMMCAQFKTAGANTIRNLGVGGSTAREALTTKKLYANGTKNFAEHIATSNANIIICNWGINDNFVPGHSAEQFVADYLELKGIVTAAGKTFIAETSNPLSYPQNNARNQLIKHYAATLVSAGTQHGFEVINIHSAIADWFPNYAAHLEDCVHPNAVLYIYIGLFLYRYLNENGHLSP